MSLWALPLLVPRGILPASRVARIVSSPSPFFVLVLRTPTAALCAVIWTKANPTPWNDVKQEDNVKMMSVNQKFEKRYAP